MGSAMVRRLVAGGHACVVHDVHAERHRRGAAAGRHRAATLADLVGAARQAARRLADGAGCGRRRGARRCSLPLLEAGDIVIDGGNSYYRDDIRRAAELKSRGIHYVDVGTSGGVAGLERGYCLMIGGEAAVVAQLDADLRDACARRRCGAAHAGPREYSANRRAGLPALRPARRGSLRQDGPQRHRVRPDGRVRRRPQHPAQRQCRHAAARERCRDDAAAQSRVLPVRARPAARSPKSGGAAASSARGCWISPLARCATTVRWRTTRGACPIRAKAAGRSRRRSTKACRPRS